LTDSLVVLENQWNFAHSYTCIRRDRERGYRASRGIIRTGHRITRRLLHGRLSSRIMSSEISHTR